MPGGGSHGSALTARSDVALHPTVIEPVAEFLAGLEVWRRLLVHLDRLARTRIAPDAGVALLHREGAEPSHLHTLAASQSGGDLLEYRRHDQLHIRHAQMWMAGSEVRDEF